MFNEKVLLSVFFLFFSINLWGQDFYSLNRLPGNYRVNEFPGERLSLGERLQDGPGDNKFRRKRELYKWLANLLLNEETISYGIRFGWNSINDFGRQAVVFYSDIEGETTNEELNNTLGSLLGIYSSWLFFLNISDRLGFQPEFNYIVIDGHKSLNDLQTSGFHENQQSNTLKVSYHLNCLEIPFVIKYKLKNTNLFQYHLTFGILSNIYIKGSSEWHYSETGLYYEAPEEISGKKNLININKYSFNLISGAGFEMKNLMVNLRYEYGVSDLNSVKFSDEPPVFKDNLEDYIQNSWEYYDHNLTFSIGYKFSVNK